MQIIFFKREHDYMIDEVTRLFGLFDELVCENEISDDLQDFLDDCNLPHVVLVTDHYYNLLGEFEINSNDLPFFGILNEFTSQKKEYGYIDDEYSGEFGYDRRYEVTYVENRQESIEDFFSSYVEEYSNDTDDESEDDDED